MKDKTTVVSPALPAVGREDLPRVYPIRYVSRNLIKAVWVLFALMVILIFLSVDLSSVEWTETLQISPLIKNLVVFFAMGILGIAMVTMFYRKRGNIQLDGKGIRFPNGDVLSWRSIDWYKISVHRDRYGLKRVTFKANEGYTVRMIIEDGNQMNAFEKDVKETLEKYNSLAKDRGLASLKFEAYYTAAVLMIIYFAGGFFFGWGYKYFWIGTSFLIICLGAGYLMNIYIPRLQVTEKDMNKSDRKEHRLK